MKRRNHRLLLTIGLILILISVLSTHSGCIYGEPFVEIIIENQTDQVLTIYYALEDNFTGLGAPLGDISPGEQITIRRDINIGEYPVTAKNMRGEVVFSQVYSFTTNLQWVDGWTYKAVIPPLQDGS